MAWLRSRRWPPLKHSISSGVLLRGAATAFVVFALLVVVMQARNADDMRDAIPATATAADPLSAELMRCRTAMPEQLAVDDSCRRAWAESRRRFFAPASSRHTSAPTDPVVAAPFKNQDRIAPLDASPAPAETR